jgi:hypothetical protein
MPAMYVAVWDGSPMRMVLESPATPLLPMSILLLPVILELASSPMAVLLPPVVVLSSA